jgi:hypothetical protein
MMISTVDHGEFVSGVTIMYSQFGQGIDQMGQVLEYD